MGRTREFEEKVKVLEYKMEKLQQEAQNSVFILDAKIRVLEEKLNLKYNGNEEPQTIVKPSLSLKCEVCGKIIYTERGMARHMKDKHIV